MTAAQRDHGSDNSSKRPDYQGGKRQITMKSIYAFFITIALITGSFCARAQNGGDLNLNGIAAFEQLRKEYYIGALYLGWPGRDPAAIANMPGKKRMQLNITADRWPALRFSQMWNQAITINNPSAVINANALDILAFTSIPKGDLVEGDQLVFELTGNNSTLVLLNGTPALRTNGPALFTMLLNAWIGPRPPTSEFKRDILDTPKDQAGTDLVTRFQSIHPNDTRKKTIAGWGLKVEPEAPAATATTVVTTAAQAPAAAATPVPAPQKSEPSAVAVKPQPEVKPETKSETKPRGAAPAASPAEVAKAAQADADAIAAAQQNKEAHDKQQEQFSNEYLGAIRKAVMHNIEYPRRAVKENIEGLVMVRIKVDHGGKLNSVEIAQSADETLDEAAEKAVKKAAPFPKASDALEGDSFETLIPVVFKLTQ
jgi:TonB family protein